MRAFRASGSFRIDKRSWQKFSVEVAADDDLAAREKILSTLGSRHRLNRRSIRIDEMREIEGEEITDHVVQYCVEGS